MFLERGAKMQLSGCLLEQVLVEINRIGGVNLAYQVHQPKRARAGSLPVLLVHGFASNQQINWVSTGWVKHLMDLGFVVITMDNRGHGQSQKFYALDDYSLATMAQDCLNLLGFLDIAQAHVLGYSMGARIAAVMAINHPGRIGKLILGGNGDNMIRGSGDWTAVRDGILADNLSQVTDPRARAFRIFAESTHGDLRALSVCVMSVREIIPVECFANIAHQTLIVIGENDDVAGSGSALAQIMQNARFVQIPKRDHMRSVGDRVFFDSVSEFLSGS